MNAPVRQRQGRPRGAARRRRRLHGRRAGDDRARRLADDGVPDPRRRPVLRRHVLPEAQLPAADGGHRPTPGRNRARTRSPRTRRPARGHLPHGPAAARPTSCRAPTTSTAPCRRWPPTFDARVGRLRRGAEVPVDDEPRPRAGRVPAHRRRRAPARSSRRRSTRWRRAGCTTTSAVGFARYSVDREWLVPHFEKMLYDQALLVRVYAHAAVALDEPRWRQVVAETVEYVLRDLRQPAGGFSSAEDADSPGPDGHGHEGLFHTWTVDEVARRARRRRRRRPRLLGHHRRGQLRGPLDPQPAARPGRSSPARRRSRTPAGGCSRPASSGPARVSTTRCSPSGTR